MGTVESLIHEWKSLMTLLVESRENFVVASNVLYFLIERQSGELSRALMELVTNSIDGGATRVDVLLPRSGTGFEVIDNGAGFKDAEEVRAYYKHFAFVHTGDQYAKRRQFGFFGVGRGQIWQWASTRYITNHMEIDTDVKVSGLDFTLREYSTVLHAGCRIVGTFYEPQTPLSLQATVRELGKWARFIECPIYVNGELVTQSRSDIAWSQEDEVAHYQFNSDASLLVYNMGMFVCALPAGKFGTGGVILSKVPLALDMGRTQPQAAVCPVWRTIQSRVRALHRSAAFSSKSLSDAQRTAIINGLLAGELTLAEVWDKPLFVTIKGRGLTVDSLVSGQRFTIANNDHRVLADILHGKDGLTVLADKTVEQWGLRRSVAANEPAGALKKILLSLASPLVDSPLSGRVSRLRAESFAELKDTYTGDQRALTEEETSPAARLVLAAVERCLNSPPGAPTERLRRLVPGVSKTAAAWTDGHSTIFLTDTILERAWRGEWGLRELYRILVHEYGHTTSSESEHVHGPEFYQAFHDFMIHNAQSEIHFVRRWCRVCCDLAGTKRFARLRPPKWVSEFRGVPVDDTTDTESATTPACDA
ncbi:ATP-binding protein [Sinimarinibacterium sp. CAU 1509]|uniref:ATP-binding protein n=1 Tax=Sinimarinibacterium sp. CAU 1509 TaxID=2562283 RepID=UPI00146DFB1E|nr:ATP-binding protein [Sinimarinibacterium sp. CAU 1509]